jgi:hypothetical protein
MPTVAWSCARTGMAAIAEDANAMAINDLLLNMTCILLLLANVGTRR